MRLYDNAYKSNYEELKTYYPVWYRNVLEMDALWRVTGKQLDGIQAGIIQAVDNCFVEMADAQTIAKLENFLHITYEGTRTLEERRRLVKSSITGFGKMSASKIKDIIAAFTDAPTIVDFFPGDVQGNNYLLIYIQRGTVEHLQLRDIDTILERRLPAHLVYRLHLTYKYETVIHTSRRHYVFDFELCGTKPEPAFIGIINGIETAVEGDLENIDFVLKEASEIEPAGQHPDATTLGYYNETSANVDAEIKAFNIDYPQCGTADAQV